MRATLAVARAELNGGRTIDTLYVPRKSKELMNLGDPSKMGLPCVKSPAMIRAFQHKFS
jgi:hypothetical protein